MYQSLALSQNLLFGMSKAQLFLGISDAKQPCGVSTYLHSELKGDKAKICSFETEILV